VASYKLLIKPSAVKELEDIPNEVRRRIASKIQALAMSPRPHGCEKLSGQERYRVRQGQYRVVYSVNDKEQTILIVKIGHRREVYR
jgi:mRNA interferase RelE/StbE